MWVGILLIAIIALAAWLRLYDIKNYPPGIFPDVAANGEDVMLILDGDVRPFYPRGNGREALFFYLQALLVKIYGIHVWPMHAASALIGIATVAAVYFATRPWFGRLSGLLAAFFLATNHWHIALSRTGFRAIMVPLFVLLFTAAVGYLIRSVKHKNKSKVKRDRARYSSYLYAILAGAAFAGGFYSYIAYRAMIGVVLGIALLLLVDDWLLPGRKLPHFMRYGQHLVLALLAAAVVIAPLGIYFTLHPDAIVGRAGQVSIFSPDLQREVGGGTLAGTLQYSTRETLMSFFAGSGDLNWRHNVAGFPLLNPLVGILFLLGLAWTIHGTVMVLYAVARGRQVHLGMVYPYILLLLLGMLLPVITTAEGLPHGLRSVGLVAPIFILAGTAGSVVWYWLQRHVGKGISQAAVWGVGIGLLVLSGLYGGALYFLIARNDPAAHAAYRADLPVVTEYIKGVAAEGKRPYLVLDEFSLQSVHWLTTVAAHDHVVGDQPHPDVDQHLWRQLDPAQSHLIPLQPGEVMIFTQSTLPDADRYKEQHPGVQQLEQRYNRFGQEIMRVYGSSSDAPAEPVGEEPPSLDA